MIIAMIYKVKPEDLDLYLDAWLNKKDLPLPFNLMYCEKDGKFIALDNSFNECYVEEFDNEKRALFWLNNDYSTEYSKEDIDKMEIDDFVFIFKVDYEKNEESIKKGSIQYRLNNGVKFYPYRHPAIYLRYKNNEDNYYINQKKEILVNELKKKGYKNLEKIEFYIDKNANGFSDIRVNFNRMIEDLKNRKISIIETPSLSQITRQTEMLIALDTILRETDVKLFAIKEKELPFNLYKKKFFELNNLFNENNHSEKEEDEFEI